MQSPRATTQDDFKERLLKTLDVIFYGDLDEDTSHAKDQEILGKKECANISSQIRAAINILYSEIQQSPSDVESQSALRRFNGTIQHLEPAKSLQRKYLLAQFGPLLQDINQHVLMHDPNYQLCKAKELQNRLRCTYWKIHTKKISLNTGLQKLFDTMSSMRDFLDYIHLSYTLYEIRSLDISSEVDKISVYKFFEQISLFVLENCDIWSEQAFSNSLRGFQNLSKVPDKMWQALSQKCATSNMEMSGEDIGYALYGVSGVLKSQQIIPDSLNSILTHLWKAQNKLATNVQEISAHDARVLLRGSALSNQILQPKITDYCLELEREHNLTEQPFITPIEKAAYQYIVKHISQKPNAKINIINHNVYYMGFEMDILLENSTDGVKINIELDGTWHTFKAMDDKKRDEYLASQEIRVIRIKNKNIYDHQNMNNIFRQINYHLGINRI